MPKASRTRWLLRFAQGQALVAGSHPLDTASGIYNLAQTRALVPQSDIVAIHWADRTEGLLLARGNPLGIEGLADVASRGLRVARRGAGSGSQVLLEAPVAARLRPHRGLRAPGGVPRGLRHRRSRRGPAQRLTCRAAAPDP